MHNGATTTLLQIACINFIDFLLSTELGWSVASFDARPSPVIRTTARRWAAAATG